MGSTRYFWAVGRNVRIDDTAMSRGMWQGINHAFANEDKPLIELQQQELGGTD